MRKYPPTHVYSTQTEEVLTLLIFLRRAVIFSDYVVLNIIAMATG